MNIGDKVICVFCGCKVNSNGTISVDKLLKFMKELEE